MTSAAATPNPVTPAQVLGNLLGVDPVTAQAVLAGALTQARPTGLAVLAASTQAPAQLALGIRPRTSSPFAF